MPFLKKLSEREEEVASYVAKGFSNGEIAFALGIELSTVQTHMRLIYLKLGAENRVEVARKYLSAAGEI